MESVCRLFGMTAGTTTVSATFWLLGAPDSLAQQSRHNPDGTGLGTFDDQGRPVQERQPLEALADRAFAAEARERRSCTFLGHVRHGTGGGVSVENSHPFEFDGRFYAHNGLIQDMAALERHLGSDGERVRGETDSERYAALVAREIRRANGDVARGIVMAAGWISENLPIYSINLLVTSPHELWALRQGDSHPLLVLDRRTPQTEPLHHRGSPGTTTVHSEHLSRAPSVVVATEAMDADPGWESMRPGELLHVDSDLNLNRESVLDTPVHALSWDQLDDRGRSAQATTET